jgi:hypothetical protein
MNVSPQHPHALRASTAQTISSAGGGSSNRYSGTPLVHHKDRRGSESTQGRGVPSWPDDDADPRIWCWLWCASFFLDVVLVGMIMWGIAAHGNV